MLQRLQSWDRRLGLRVRNNPRGILTKYLADMQWRISRWQSPYTRDKGVRKSIDNSAFDFGQLYDADRINAVQSDLHPHLMDDEQVYISERDGVELYRSLQFDWTEFESVQHVLENQELTDTVRSYFGCDFKPAFASILRYEHVSSEQENSTAAAESRNWHLDTSAHPNAIRFHISLTGGGALHIIPRDRTQELLSTHGYDELTQTPQLVESNSDATVFESQPGSALLFNPLEQLHRGTNPSDADTRTILIFSLLPD